MGHDSSSRCAVIRFDDLGRNAPSVALASPLWTTLVTPLPYLAAHNRLQETIHMSITSPRSGGQILIDQLVIQGVGHIHRVPGESYLAALDALHDSTIEVVVCRQEAGPARGL